MVKRLDYRQLSCAKDRVQQKLSEESILNGQVDAKRMHGAIELYEHSKSFDEILKKDLYDWFQGSDSAS